MLGPEIRNFSTISPAVISFLRSNSNISLRVGSFSALNTLFIPVNSMIVYLDKYLNTISNGQIILEGKEVAVSKKTQNRRLIRRNCS